MEGEKAFEENFTDYVKNNYPMRRLGTSDEVANLIGFLASDRARFVYYFKVERRLNLFLVT